MTEQTSEVKSAAPDSSLVDALRLSMLPGIGPRTLASLIDRFGDPTRVLAARGEELAEVPGVGSKLIHVIRTAGHHVDVMALMNWCRAHQATILRRGVNGYPRQLEELPDAPPILFALGDLLPVDRLSVAIVGTRHATQYGLKQAERFGYSLARAGITVVSGLARGIDSAAHEGALNAGGRTIAVLGSGLGQIYPAENRGLAKGIAADGAVISEYSPDAKPRGGMFPQRNRLISGLSLATLVVEAPDRSGSLITARLAMEQNRDVMAIPGPITSRASRGCNQLIRDGAKLVQTIDDILEELGPLREAVPMDSGHQVRNPSELQLNDLERRVLGSIEDTSTSVDAVIQACRLPAHQVIATISVLEMRRLVRRMGGQSVVRV